eukprot:TRINITY_DN12572_c4_g9_i1.p2 TRINITY_DN12572_c4_g9~~TRINITY_DN12572_c4_g9_i1.p2  ORF type:complete len:179 (+),score=40.83 TRINITY_DN12572_c4_g9_i1:2135-2671(+)
MSRKDVTRVNSELFLFTYGSLVAQLLEDYEVDAEVNAQLDKMGYNIGVRIVDDFVAHATSEPACRSFQDSCIVIAKEGFKAYLGVTPSITKWSDDRRECSLILDDNNNPLATFAELPMDHRELHFGGMLTGILRGALETVQYRVQCEFAQDALQGDSTTEIRIKLIEELAEQAPPGDD